MVPEPVRGYVADTNVLSRHGPAIDANVAEWLRRNAGRTYVSVVTVAEMRRGLLLLEAKEAALADRKARLAERQRIERMHGWYDQVTREFADRLLPIDLSAAQRWAETSVRFPSLRDADKAIAATALARGLGVATRNLGDFRRTGLALVNPFDPASWDEGWNDDPLAPLLRH